LVLLLFIQAEFLSKEKQFGFVFFIRADFLSKKQLGFVVVYSG
jgi:hypothetical protein